MPPVVAFAVAALEVIGDVVALAAVSVGIGADAALAIGAFAENALIFAGVNAGISLLSGGAHSSGSGASGLVSQPTKLHFGQDAQEARVVGYGRCSAGGTVKYWEATGADHKYLWFVAAYHDTQIDAVESFYVNDTSGLHLIAFDGSGNATTSPYSGFMSRYDKLGTTTQTVETNLDGASSAWTSAHTLNGIAYYVLKLTYDKTVYPSGYPDPLIIFRARRVWDPRLDPSVGGSGSQSYADESTWTWTQNAALCTLDYVRGIKLNGTFIGGMKTPLAGIDIDSWVAAANTCDENVALKAGGTEKRYTINGIVSMLEDKQGVFAAMLQAFAAVPVIRNGKLGVIAGAAITPSTTLMDDDLCGQLTINPSRSFQNKHNTVTSIYYDRLAKQGTSDAPPLQEPTFVAADGGVTLEIEYRHRFTDSVATAQRINKIMLSDEREQFSFTGTYKPKAAKIPVGGTFYFTSAAAGYNTQKMRLMSRRRNSDGSFEIVARQETDAKYSWAESIEELPPPSFVTHQSFDPTVVTAPGGSDVHVSGTSIAGDSGALVAALLLTADAPPNPHVQRVLTQYKLHTDSVYQQGPVITPPATTAYITGIADGVAYDVGFAYQTAFGTSSYTIVSSTTPTSYNIDTGMIALQAATLFEDGSLPSGPITPTANSWNNLDTFTYTSVGKPICISSLVWLFNSDNGSHNVQFRIQRDGTTIYPQSAMTAGLTVVNTAWLPLPALFSDSPSAGSHTYTFDFNPTSAALLAYNIYFNGQEVKR